MNGYVESYRGQVLASECDLMGHLNIQYYISRMSHAPLTMGYLVGIVPEDLKERKRGFAAVQQNSRYMKELLAGDIIHMNSGVLKNTDKTITFHHKLFNSASGEQTMETTLTVAYMDIANRKAVPLTEEMRQKIQTMAVKTEDMA
jgi:acyl-CoA thioester hydrolase